MATVLNQLFQNFRKDIMTSNVICSTATGPAGLIICKNAHDKIQAYFGPYHCAFCLFVDYVQVLRATN